MRSVNGECLLMENISVNGEYFICNCEIGVKKKIFKHGIVCMVKEKILQLPAGAADKPISGLRKRGRPTDREKGGRPTKAKTISKYTINFIYSYM